MRVIARGRSAGFGTQGVSLNAALDATQLAALREAIDGRGRLELRYLVEVDIAHSAQARIHGELRGPIADAAIAIETGLRDGVLVLEPQSDGASEPSLQEEACSRAKERARELLAHESDSTRAGTAIRLDARALATRPSVSALVRSADAASWLRH
jgi:hypothetical protein